MSLSASAVLQGNNSLKSKLLHGSDIPAKFDGVVARVKAIREAPSNFGSPFIIDFAEPLPYGCGSWAVNLTNTQVIADKIGDDLAAINGKRVYLKKIKVNNPATDQEVWSLVMDRIEGEKPKPAAVVDVKAKAKNAKPPKTSEGIKESDLPF